MKSILYILSVILLTGWLVGVLVYAIGAWVHMLLISSLLLTIALSRLDRRYMTERVTGHNE